MDVLMPQLGETVAEGKIVKWFKSAGDAVAPGDNLFEIETDKTSMEVPSTVSGTLSEIRFHVGEVAKVGAVVAVIAGAGEVAALAAPPEPTTKAPRRPFIIPPNATVIEDGAGFAVGINAPVAVKPLDPFNAVRTPERNYGPARLPGGAIVTPLARRLAGERGIDLSRVIGSGPRGRIVARDIATVPSPAPATGPSAAQIKAQYSGVTYTEVPLDTMRATIAARLTEAKQTIPHFYLTADVETGRLIAMRAEANAAAPNAAGDEPAFRLSLNDFIIKAWAAALQRVPAANAVWAGDRILRFVHSDIGVGSSVEGGLVVPVIRNAEVKMLTAISAEMRDFATRARARKLNPEEWQGGASAISNLGMYGVREFSAIINPPHATILGVGASRRAPVEAADGSVRFIDQMTVTLSCDHRIIDGAVGAELLAAFKSFIEKPVTALV